MTDTPRTKAAIQIFGDYIRSEPAVPVDFAEELEVELSDAKTALAEARAEIERLKINTRCDLDLLAADTVQMNKMQDEIEAIVFVKKKAVEEIVFLNQEIERKDKLVEQMRDALNLMLEGAIHDFHYVCQHRDNCLCWGCQKVRVKAALSAAERGE
jgi:hypothetical protein